MCLFGPVRLSAFQGASRHGRGSQVRTTDVTQPSSIEEINGMLLLLLVLDGIGCSRRDAGRPWNCATIRSK